jgi:hypothetical protein
VIHSSAAVSVRTAAPRSDSPREAVRTVERNRAQQTPGKREAALTQCDSWASTFAVAGLVIALMALCLIFA